MGGALEQRQVDDERQRQGRTATLGDVLYADKTRPRIPESDWVALVRSIAARDPRALHALYRRTHRLVFTLIMRITRSRETAEELTVDVFHDVWRRAGGYDPDNGTVIGWVMNQARSRAIDRLRLERRKKRVNPDPGDAADDASCGGPHEALELEQQARRVRDALSLLTVHERRAIETAYFAELTYAEAAARLGEPVGTLKTRIRSGLGKLRRALAGEAKA
jgi:RNA polymerase sigma-70 factor, ECF subfamily